MRRRYQLVPLAGLAVLCGGWLLSRPADTSGQAGAGALPQIERHTHKSYVESLSGSEVSFEMIAVPGGVFLMGSPDGEPGRNADEGPRRPVRVAPFWMARTEVSWDEYNLYRNEKGAESPEQNEERLLKDPDAVTGPTPPYVPETYGHGRDGHPAICMTWHAAAEYCRWLSAKTGKSYRLPTEAEWEWACRAGSTTAYCFGNDPKGLDAYGWYVKNSPLKPGDKPTTHKVGTLKPNAFGLCDMHGNVAEWCLDQYDKDMYKSFPPDKPAERPVKLPGDRRFSHVTRGGSWADDPPALRSAVRRPSDKSWLKHDPQRPQSIWWLTKMDVIGFRVVRAVDEQAELKGFKSKITRDSRN
jgi:formylglycine-generating enzyme required for sulfatase activity